MSKLPSIIIPSGDDVNAVIEKSIALNAVGSSSTSEDTAEEEINHLSRKKKERKIDHEITDSQRIPLLLQVHPYLYSERWQKLGPGFIADCSEGERGI